MRRNSENRSTAANDSNHAASAKRSLLRQLIGRLGFPSTGLGGNAPVSSKRDRLLLESLEPRQLMAGDMEMLFTDGVTSSDTSAVQTSTTAVTTVDRSAEGEAAPDLVQFAKDLADAGVIFYGAHWCPPCSQQKALFEDGQDNLPFVEVTNPDRTPGQIAIDEGITSYPTWEFPDSSRLQGVQSLATLSARSGVPIPQSDQPVFEPIGDKTVQIGAPLHIPVDAYDPDGGPLTVTVSVADSNLLEAVVLDGNRSIRIDMETYGDMVFELFENRAPAATGRVIELAEDNFYDGILFHRIIDDFVLQAGDPTGTGAGGSDLGDFDDDFHPELVHTGSGILSYAKAGDDTNDSQFFITEGPQRFLDFNHSVFGQLVEGEDVREAISEHARVNPNGNPADNNPTTPIKISTIDVFEDTENSVVMLKATGTATGTTNVTFTVADQDGNTFSETIAVSVVADNANSQPFLNPITTPAAVNKNTAATLQLSSTDIEGDAVSYFVSSGSASVSASVNATTGLVTVTPVAGFTGTVPVTVGVRPGVGVTGNSSSDQDTQLVAFTFEDNSVATPSGLDLLAASDTGVSDTDNITKAGSLSFVVSGVTSGATVELVNATTGAVLGVGAATNSTVTITTSNIAALGDGTYSVAARQRIGTTNSPLTSSLVVTYDTVSPTSVVSSATTQANVGRPFTTDLINAEEGAGLVYALSGTSPTAMTINAATGQITWTPTAAQIGTNTVSLTLTDSAGNVRTESFDVTVAGEPLAEIKLTLTDLQGNLITKVQPGQEFLLNLIGVDARDEEDRDGIFAAFADVLFDNSLIRPVPGAGIDFTDRFPTVQKGTFSNGLIDEVGAATDRLTPSQLKDSLIATIRMEALQSGTVNIRSEPADASDSEVLLYGNNDRIPADTVAYGAVALAIGQNFIVADDTITVAEDSGVTLVDVLANDTIVSGNGTLSVVSATQPTNGAAVSVDDGEVRFLLDSNFNGDFEFTYQVRDNEGIQETATVTVTVTPVNDPPVGVDDTFNVDQGSTGNAFDVIANDTLGPDSGETLTVSEVGTSTAGATMTLSSDKKSILYTPPASFTGTDTFTYTVTDGGLTDQVTVTVTVAPADPPPTAVDDTFSVTEDDAEAAFDVLSNDTPDASNQAFVIDSIQTPSQGGSVRKSEDGTQFFYSPMADFNGSEQVTYTIRDTGGGLSVGTVTFTVTAVNDAPPISDSTVGINRGGVEKLALAVNGLPANVDSGETLSFANLGTPTAGGTVRIDTATGSIFYKAPSASFTGSDSFTYEVQDGSGLTSTGTITVEVSDYTERDVFLTFAESGIQPSQLHGIVLRGTDALDAEVEVPLSSLGGQYSFQNVLPGNYTVEIPAIPFFENTREMQQISVISGPDDGDTSVNASVGRLLPQYISIRDWLGSTPRQSLLLAIQPGEASTLLIPSAATSSIDTPAVALDEDGETLTITGTRTVTDSSTGTTSTESVRATLPTVNDRRVQARGEAGEMRLYRVSVETSDVTFETVSSGSAAAAEGEAISAAAATPSILLGGVQAEGESLAASSVSRTDLFVPVADDAASVSAAAPDDSVDAAMQDIATELTFRSKSADAVAENSLSDNPLAHDAIDALIATDL
ncbi:Ig-like domain-containing protein [Novipirellula artificiosorum]|uniref:peptidylprolyl isomerase n=1 Tax=Novipirellula artificiosorum TaxID=2528016 RepID=A0A5C6D4P3_9BACT|nr:tandem-95 repeat protein [Novipirellula artificiosorum]TWU31790.1 putative peptidyl-prolyl cis-trans isomerase [Novipirellula artificiosorum]